MAQVDYGQGQGSSWQPSSDVMAHSGGLLDLSLDLFCPPPSEIGKIISAHSTLTQDKRSMSLDNRLIWAAVGFIVAAGITGLIGFQLFSRKNHGGLSYDTLLMAVLVGLFTTGVILALTGFAHRCSYVGENGLAVIRIKGSRQGPMKASVFTFDQAAHLFTKQTRMYYNGIYTGTNYDYRWCRPDGSRAFQLQGSYRSKEGRPKSAPKFHLAQTAEIAWTKRLLGDKQTEMNATGGVEFQVGSGRTVRLEPGAIEFRYGGEPQRVSVADLRECTIAEGVFRFKHRDSHWYSADGKYTVPYASIANAKLFLVCLELVCGLRFG